MAAAWNGKQTRALVSVLVERQRAKRVGWRSEEQGDIREDSERVKGARIRQDVAAVAVEQYMYIAAGNVKTAEVRRTSPAISPPFFHARYTFVTWYDITR